MDSTLIIYTNLKSNSFLLHYYSCCIVITIRSVRLENTACTKVVNLFARNVRIALIITTKKLDLGDLVQEVVCISLFMWIWTCRILNIEYLLFFLQAGTVEKIKNKYTYSKFKIRHFQIHELPRTLLI